MRTLKSIIAAGILLGFVGTAQAALLSRLSGQAYYDDVLNITWLADANLAATNTFGLSGMDPSGQMNWGTANTWLAAMNAANYLGANNWRLPKTVDTGLPGCNSNFLDPDDDCGYAGYNITDLSKSELAYMHYTTLGNAGLHQNNAQWGCGLNSYFCLANDGPFSNLQPGTYLSRDIVLTQGGSSYIFRFDFSIGQQDVTDTGTPFYYAWAVRDGDLAPIPVPGAVWLLGSMLGVMGLLRRKTLSGTGS